MHVVVVGRVTGDVERVKKRSVGGVSFPMASETAAGAGKWITTWVDVLVTGELGDRIGPMLSKGCGVVVRGHLWCKETADGKRFLKVRADSVDVLRTTAPAAPKNVAPAADDGGEE